MLNIKLKYKAKNIIKGRFKEKQTMGLLVLVTE